MEQSQIVNIWIIKISGERGERMEKKCEEIEITTENVLKSDEGHQLININPKEKNLGIS